MARILHGDGIAGGENARKRAIGASGDHTVKGSVFDVARGYDRPAPWAIRTLRNAFHDRWSGRLDHLRGDLDRQKRAYTEAQATGDVETAAVIVGEAVDLVGASAPASAIVAQILVEALDCLSNGARLLDASLSPKGR